MLVKMHADDQDGERIAREMAGRFDEAAAWIALEMAEIADRLFDKRSAAWWQYIASAIEQLQTAAVIAIPLHRPQVATVSARSQPPDRVYEGAESATAGQDRAARIIVEHCHITGAVINHPRGGQRPGQRDDASGPYAGGGYHAKGGQR